VFVVSLEEASGERGEKERMETKKRFDARGLLPREKRRKKKNGEKTVLWRGGRRVYLRFHRRHMIGLAERKGELQMKWRGVGCCSSRSGKEKKGNSTPQHGKLFFFPLFCCHLKGRRGVYFDAWTTLKRKRKKKRGVWLGREGVQPRTVSLTR